MKNLTSKILIFSIIFFPIFIQNLKAQTLWPDWIRVYDNSNNLNEQSWALGIDPSGNYIAITGYKFNGYPTGVDYLTVEYNVGGQQLWTSTYNSDWYDYSTSVKVDINGNAYVTGYANYKITTVKYSSSGSQLWAQIYPIARTDQYYRVSLALDEVSNVYVTGSIAGAQLPKSLPADSSGSDAASIDDIITIKYNSNGGQVWTNIYDNPTHADDHPFGIVYKSGNLFVTGISQWWPPNPAKYKYTTIRYDINNGNRIYVAYYDGPITNCTNSPEAIDANSSGYAFVTGRSYNGSNYDYATVLYDPNGNQQWIQRYNGPGNGDDLAYGIKMDNLSNIYAVGGSLGSGTGMDYALLKYNFSGQQQWVQRYNGTSNGDDIAYGIASNPLNYSIYITGKALTSTAYDFLTLAYNYDGTMNSHPLYYNGYTNQDDIPSAIEAMDGINTPFGVYVTGTGNGNGAGLYYDCETIQYVTSLDFPIHVDKNVLLNNSPNPFNPATFISFSLPNSGYTTLKVYDQLGRFIKEIVSGNMIAGSYIYRFDAGNLSSGVYFYTLSSGSFVETKKMLLVK